MTSLTGAAAVSLLELEIGKHTEGLAIELAPYDPVSAVRTWHTVIRGFEELINAPFHRTIDDAATARLLALPVYPAALQNPRDAFAVVPLLTPYLGSSLANRFAHTILYVSSMALAFATHGISISNQFQLKNVAGLVNYLQARRRHCITLLHWLPAVCNGKQTMRLTDAVPLFLRMVETSCIAITGMHRDAVLAEALPNFVLNVGKHGVMGNIYFDPLEDAFLEPERISIIAMSQVRTEQFAKSSLENEDPKKLFSAVELRNSVRTIQAVYDKFGVNDANFSAITSVITRLSYKCEDDYFISLTRKEIHAVFKKQSVISVDELERLLINYKSDYVGCSNCYTPFIAVGSRLVSNVNLLMRFLYAHKNIHLANRRKFQINSGFIFEDVVKADLAAAGFTVTEIKRINRKEFDVVTVLRDTIYNFQCKNTWIDITAMDEDRKRFVRHNHLIVDYFRRAVAKEVSRENLLLEKLKLKKIRHYVVSRFPVITEDERIISYNRLGKRANDLVAGAAS